MWHSCLWLSSIVSYNKKNNLDFTVDFIWFITFTKSLSIVDKLLSTFSKKEVVCWLTFWDKLLNLGNYFRMFCCHCSYASNCIPTLTHKSHSLTMQFFIVFCCLENYIMFVSNEAETENSSYYYLIWKVYKLRELTY